MHRRRVSTLSLLLLAACTATTAVRLAPAPENGRPVFMITAAVGEGLAPALYGLSVVRCGSDDVMWTIAADGGRSSPRRIVYGTAPAGYLNEVRPRILGPGCYNVFVSGGGRSTFTVPAGTEIHPDTSATAPAAAPATVPVTAPAAPPRPTAPARP